MAAPIEFDLKIKENPALRLQAIMDDAGYEDPVEFMVKAMDVFERAVACDGKVVVEDSRGKKKYVYKVVNKVVAVVARSGKKVKALH